MVATTAEAGRGPVRIVPTLIIVTHELSGGDDQGMNSSRVLTEI